MNTQNELSLDRDKQTTPANELSMSHLGLIFEMEKKRLGVAYALWFFSGIFGGHNFYLRRTVVAIIQLALSLTILLILILPEIIGTSLSPMDYITGSMLAIINYISTIPIWLIIDACLIPYWVRKQNSLIAAQLTE